MLTKPPIQHLCIKCRAECVPETYFKNDFLCATCVTKRDEFPLGTNVTPLGYDPDAKQHDRCIEAWRAEMAKKGAYFTASDHIAFDAGWHARDAEPQKPTLSQEEYRALTSDRPVKRDAALMIAHEMLYRITSGRVASIGSIDNTFIPQISRAEVDQWRAELKRIAEAS